MSAFFRSLKQDCPWTLRVNLQDKGDRRGKELFISQFKNEHNHAVNPCVVAHHPKKRKLDAATEGMAAEALKLHANKKLLLQDLRQKSERKLF